jgi:hypothetical protein
VLSALRLSDTPLARNGAATFVVWAQDEAAGRSGRYFVVIDGVGFPENLR